ncbi:MAG TPA: hypothetical protein PLJ84_02020 [Bacteroidales bacterium]|nr:hypothetical protein [Bacteroidales bacterium]
MLLFTSFNKDKICFVGLAQPGVIDDFLMNGEGLADRSCQLPDVKPKNGLSRKMPTENHCRRH